LGLGSEGVRKRANCGEGFSGEAGPLWHRGGLCYGFSGWEGGSPPPTPHPALLPQRRSVWGGGSPDEAADCSSVQLEKSLPRAAGGTARRM
jgi:hypothetical protein